MVRLQLDSLFRVCFLAAAPEAEEVLAELFEGKQFRQIKDRSGKKLVDGRLKELAAPHHPWAVPVYERTSGWIHFSMDHITTTWQVSGDEFSSVIPLSPSIIPASLWAEILGAMAQATAELLDYALGWAQRKGMPPGQTRVLDGDSHTDSPQ